jgi:hypothetical protein
MKIIIPADAAEVANAAYWRELLQCSRPTMWRGEKQGRLIPTGTKRRKLYTKKAILAWLNITE